MIDINVSIDEQRGKVGLLNYSDEQFTLGQVFTGTPQFYPGSVVQIQEIATILLRKYDESLVSVDQTWFANKERLGTFQILDLAGLPKTGADDSGYITFPRFQIIRYSYYTITANPDVPFGKHEQISLDNCNAYLVPSVYTFPDNFVEQPGFKYYDLNPAWLGSNTISKAPLADTEFNQVIPGLGLYLKPGVEGITFNYKALVINDIYTGYEQVTPPTCQFLAGNCDAQFAAFLISQGVGTFDNQADCTAFNGGNECVAFQWPCPQNPLEVYTYYTLVN